MMNLFCLYISSMVIESQQDFRESNSNFLELMNQWWDKECTSGRFFSKCSTSFERKAMTEKRSGSFLCQNRLSRKSILMVLLMLM